MTHALLALATIAGWLLTGTFEAAIAEEAWVAFASATGILDPRQRMQAAREALNRGNALRGVGNVAEAIRAYRRAAWLHPNGGPGHFNLGLALHETGDWRGAALAFRHAARCDARDFRSVQNVVTTIACAVEADAPRLFPREVSAGAQGREPVSIVVCSTDPGRLAAMRANFTAALGARQHEFVVIRDAASLSEGYSRGLRMARHPIVVFSHDDVELVSPRPFEAFDDALERHDIVGLAGARHVGGPAVMWAGHPHVHGWVAYPETVEGCSATVFSLESGVIGGMKVLDGMLFAARREAALCVGFDAATFDGFHFYDIDFTYRAHLAGLRIAVTTDVIAIHASHGLFDEEWRRYAARFMAKFPHLRLPKGEHHAYAAALSSRTRMARFYNELRGLAAIA